MMNDAILRTSHLPTRLRSNLARGLDALMLELMGNRATGYAPGTNDPRIDALVSDARQAYALGIIGFLPGWGEVMRGGVIEAVTVPEHTTQRLTTTEGWVFTRVRTGCVRVQRGDFCAYLTEEEAPAVARFIWDTDPETADTEGHRLCGDPDSCVSSGHCGCGVGCPERRT